MNTIKITIEVNGQKLIESYQKIEKTTYNEIVKICDERKANISDLLINDITEMTPQEAEEILFSWDI